MLFWQPQPIIYDAALNYTYPLELTDPATIPEENEDPIFYPNALYSVTNGSAIVADAKNQIAKLISGSGSNCSKCISALEIGQYVAHRVPQLVPDLLVDLCISTKFQSNSSCRENYEAQNYGAVWTQVLSSGKCFRVRWPVYL